MSYSGMDGAEWGARVTRIYEGMTTSSRSRGDWEDMRTRRASHLRERGTMAGAITLTLGPHPVDFGPAGRAEVRYVGRGERRALKQTTPIVNPPAGLLLSMTSGEVDGYVFALAETPCSRNPDVIFPLSLWIGRGERWWALGDHWCPEDVHLFFGNRAAAWLRPGEEYEPLPEGPQRVIDEMLSPLYGRWIEMEGKHA